MQDSLGAMLLPFSYRSLIVPNTLVAEIVPYSVPLAKPGLPGWHKGFLLWRNIEIPLISLAQLMDMEVMLEESKYQIAIINRVDTVCKNDYIAILLYDLPRLYKVKDNEITFVAPAPNEWIVMEVALKEQKAFIPNIPNLFKKIDAVTIESHGS